MRTRTIYKPNGDIRAVFKNGELIAGEYFEDIQKSATIWPDLPEYQSPVDGKLVSGRAQRREDLKRHGCRPWEGMEAERKEAARHNQERDRQFDRMADRWVTDELRNLSSGSRRVLGL